MKKILIIITCVIALTAIVLTVVLVPFSCGKKKNDKAGVPLDETSLPLGRYSETLDLTVGQMVSASAYIEGETASNNIMYDIIRDVVNVNVVSQFSAMIGTAYDYQLNLAMMNDNLPDMFFCSQNQLSDLIEQDMVCDLTEAYEKYASPGLRLAMEYSYTGDISVWNGGSPTIAKNRAVLDAASQNGKLYGLPFLADLFDRCPLLWIRLDWLRKYAENKNIEYSDEKELLPKNFGEYLEIAEYFANGDPDGNGKKDTYGLSLGFNSENLQGIANVYGCYPGFYMMEDGEYTYGTLNEKMVDVLNLLCGYYNNGVIDKNSALDGAMLKSALASGIIGSFFGEYWSIMGYGLGDAYLVNQQVDWIPWAIRDFEGNVIRPYVHYNINNDAFYCISAECKNPEVVVILANHIVDRFFSDDGEFTKRVVEARSSSKYENVASEMEMYMPFRLDAPNKNIRYAFDIQKALKENDTSGLSLDETTYYNNIKAFLDNPATTGKKYYPYYKIFAENGAYSELIEYAEYDYERDRNDLKVNFVRPAYYTVNTPEMNTYGSIVSDYEYQELVYMFTGRDAVTKERYKTFTDGLKSKGITQILNGLNKK